MLTIYQSDNLPVLKSLPDSSIDLIYIDPPFNTGTRRKRSSYAFDDSYTNYINFLTPRIREAYRLLAPNGSFFFHIDYREAHYAKILIDSIFGRDSFMNEIIWAYDYGARSRARWPAKHDTIFWYAKDPENYTFNYDEIDRIPYMAPRLFGAEKDERGKTPTDVWWNTIVPTNGAEKTGYPTQKPLGIINRIVCVHSNPGDTLLDFFAGSGTFGEAAYRNGRNCILVDENPDAVAVMQKRFVSVAPVQASSFRFYAGQPAPFLQYLDNPLPHKVS